MLEEAIRGHGVGHGVGGGVGSGSGSGGGSGSGSGGGDGGTSGRTGPVMLAKVLLRPFTLALARPHPPRVGRGLGPKGGRCFCAATPERHYQRRVGSV